MLNLLKSVNRVSRSVITQRAIGQRHLMGFASLYKRTGNRDYQYSLDNLANDLKQINRNVNATFEEKCELKIYAEVVETIGRCKETEYLANAAEEGYSSVMILDEYEVRRFLPERYRYESAQYLNKFVAKYPELSGFKLSTDEMGWPRRRVLLVEW